MAEVEYICISCWESFSTDDDEANEESIVCPHCGAKQNGMPEDQMTSPMPITIKDEHPQSEDDDLELGEPVEAEEAEPEEEGDTSTDAEAPDKPEDKKADINPITATWRLRSNLGLTYNFVGIEAVLNWAAGKKGLDDMQITVEETETWKDFVDFTRLIRKHPPMDAFYGSEGDDPPNSREDDSTQDTIDVIDSKDESAGGGSKDVQASKKKSRFSDPMPENLSTKRRQTMTSPGIRTTGEFTFRMADAPKKASNAPILVLMGFLLGVGSVVALWLFNLLPASPFAG